MKKQLGVSSVITLVMLVALITGCTLFGGNITRIAPITQRVEFFQGADVATAYIQIYGEDATSEIDWGDGSTREEYLVTGHLQVSHDYTAAGEYDVTVIAKNGQRFSAIVNVETDPPTVRFPFYLDNYWDEGQRVSFNIPERWVGCDAGTGQPQYISGITPGAGVTQFRMTAYDADGYKVPLFDESGDNVWGEWIDLTEDLSNLQLIFLWLGWYHDYPMGSTTMSMSAIDTMDCCDPGCGDDEDDVDWELPPIPDDAKYVDVTIEGRNQWMAEPYPSASVRIFYEEGCST